MNNQNNIYSTLQTVSNHVLTLIKQVGDMSGDVRVLSERMNTFECQLGKLERANRQIIGMLSLKMEPEKCGYLHADLETRINIKVKSDQEKLEERIRSSISDSLSAKIKDNFKDEAKTVGKTALVVLKVLAWISLAFGGSAIGLKAIGLFKAFGI